MVSKLNLVRQLKVHLRWRGAEILVASEFKERMKGILIQTSLGNFVLIKIVSVSRWRRMIKNVPTRKYQDIDLNQGKLSIL